MFATNAQKIYRLVVKYGHEINAFARRGHLGLPFSDKVDKEKQELALLKCAYSDLEFIIKILEKRDNEEASK